jgi:hypothetical protein
LNSSALACVHAALGNHGSVRQLSSVRKLLAELASPAADCLVLDPALLSPSVAETVATELAEFPRDVVAFSSVTTAALESAVILAQRTSARFVFRGTPNERSALERALMLTPYAELHTMVLGLIDPQLNRLSPVMRDRIVSMFRTGEGPYSPEALAAATALTRRSVDRSLAEAGFISARRLVEAARLTWGYRAITTPGIPLVNIAEMLGYKLKRTMDAQLTVLVGMPSGELRVQPLECADAANRIARNLTEEHDRPPHSKKPRGRSARDENNTTLTLIKSDDNTSRGRRIVSGDSAINS